MDAYESMKSRLASTGLYALSGSTAVDFELKACAEGLNAVIGEINELQAESFVPTARGYGLENREAACGIDGNGTAEERRAVLLALGAVTPGSFTKADIETVLAALGVPVRIAENTAGQKLTVKFLSEPACGRDAAQKLVEKFTPAHLAPEWDYSGISVQK